MGVPLITDDYPSTLCHKAQKMLFNRALCKMKASGK